MRPGDVVRIRSTCRASGGHEGIKSSYCGLTGTVTSDRPQPGYDIAVKVPGRETASFCWHELERINP